MHAGSLPFLFLLPVAVLIWGLISLIKATTQAQGATFKPAFFSFIIAICLGFFVSIIMDANGIDQNHPELLLLFQFSIGALAVSSVAGILFTYFQSFIPPLFIRMSLVFSLISVVLGVVTSFDTNAGMNLGNSDTSSFEAVKPSSSNLKAM